MRKTNISEAYINNLENIYIEATARIHLNKLVFDEFPLRRGVRQKDPLSPKLFTVVMRKSKNGEISEGINVDGENLTNLRLADDVAQIEKKTTLKQSELRKSESWLKNKQRKEKVHDKACKQ